MNADTPKWLRAQRRRIRSGTWWTGLSARLGYTPPAPARMRPPPTALACLTATSLVVFAAVAAWVAIAPVPPWSERLAGVAPRGLDPPLAQAAVTLSEATAPLGTAIAAAAAALVLALARRGRDVAYLAVALGGAGTLGAVVKVWSDRSRPLDDPLGPAVGSSFPSAHAVSWAALVATLALLASGRWRRAALWGGAILVLAIGASRVYLGAHHPSDVLAGYALGIGWVGAVALVRRGGGRRRGARRW